jgi:integrase
VAGDHDLIKDNFDYDVKKGDIIRDYTPEEAVTILTAARLQTNPLLRWAPWVMAYTGCRVGELLGSTASAIQHRDGVWCLVIQQGNT